MAKTTIIHTSDWHLGKRLFRKEREEEHALFLRWLERKLQETEADILLLAGDVFDSPTPPHSSLKIFYDFLNKISRAGIQSVVISGNHDSQGLISAPKNLLKEKNAFLHSRLEASADKNTVRLKTEDGEIWVKCMPYFRNHELIKAAQELDVFREDLPREEVLKNALGKFFQTWPEGSPKAKLLMGHHVFGDYSAAGSEHFIGLSGIESVPLSLFKGQVDYAALGHIHKFQELSQDPLAVYTGSPIQMRFSESKKKFVNKIEIEDGAVITEKIQIPVFRELIQIKTDSDRYIEDVKKNLAAKISGSGQAGLEPFVEVQVKMLEAKSAMADTLKEICEQNGAQLLSFLPALNNYDWESEPKEDVSKLDIQELFVRFYREKFPESDGPPDYLKERFRTLLEESSHEDA